MSDAAVNIETISNKKECTICCSEYTSTNIVACINHTCEFSSCKSCYKKYFIENPVNTKCMDCNVEFNHSTMVKLFGRTFVMKELRSAQKKILVERQLSQLPDTQNSREFKICQLAIKLSTAKNELDELNKNWGNKNHITDPVGYKEYIDKYRTLRSKINTLETDRRNIINNAQVEEDNIKSENNSVVMKCTTRECRGFITKENYMCDICDTSYCNKCLEVKNDTGDEHVCDKDNVETAKFILKQSKPCPSCGTRISKLSGCDQMWCTQCHVTFSWKSGAISTGIVHNPHYFEWLRKNPSGDGQPLRNPFDIHCGGLVYIRYLTYDIDTVCKEVDIMMYYYQQISHINQAIIPSYRTSIMRVENEAFMLYKRIDYLLGKITEESLGRSATIRDYRIQRERKILQLYELVSIVGIEEFANVNNQFKDIKNSVLDFVRKHNMRVRTIQLLAIKIENIFKYFNENACIIEHEFKCKVDKLHTYDENQIMLANNENINLLSDDDDNDNDDEY